MFKGLSVHRPGPHEWIFLYFPFLLARPEDSRYGPFLVSLKIAVLGPWLHFIGGLDSACQGSSFGFTSSGM